MGVPLRSWDGCRVLVTGASSGIGRRLALGAARRGASLALVSRRKEALEDVARQARGFGARADVFVCDVSDRAAASAAVGAVERAIGAVDVAFLNAGVGAHRTFIEHDLDAAEHVLRVNLHGALYFAHPLARSMVARRSGWLVFTASIAGLVPVPGEAVYSASKHGVIGLADALAIELEPHGVHVLTLCPGAVRTGFVPAEDRPRMPAVARRGAVEPEAVADATFAALWRGDARVVVPQRLRVAVGARGLLPSLVRWGTRLATRSVLAI